MVNNPKLVGSGLVGAALIAAIFFVQFEGTKHTTYIDPPGIPTICYGHTQGVKIGQNATEKQCLAYLGEDTKKVSEAIDRLVMIEISDTTKASFISFSYNMGIGAFSRSTMLKKLNNNDIIGACQELPKWICSSVKEGSGDSSGSCKSKKKNKTVLKGLVIRREAEQKLCLSGIK